MIQASSRLRRYAPWVGGAALGALSLGVGAWALGGRSFDPRALLGVVGRDAGPRTAVAVGAVANATGVGGELVLAAARRGIDDALREHANVSQVTLAERSARVVGSRHGHVLDVNVVRVEQQPGRLLAEASVVVSSLPERAYEFASTSTVTLTGATADGDQAVAEAVRRAMRSATSQAVEQMAGR